MRLIDADELRQKMCYVCIDTDEETEKGRVKWDSGLWIRYKVFEDTLILAPTVDAEPIRHGKWKKSGYWGRVYKCDQCGNYLDFDGVNTGRGSANYCPNCGAKMDEVNENETY